MSQVEDHYSSLLAKHYTWMFGTPFAAKKEPNAYTRRTGRRGQFLADVANNSLLGLQPAQP